MIIAYRLSKSQYPGNSGHGAALEGGRWNPKGAPVIYTAGAVFLAMLEILVHYSILPRDYVRTEIRISVDCPRVEDLYELPTDWTEHEAITREIGRRWISGGQSAALSVPSSVVPTERNYLLNPAHPDFPKIVFSKSTPFSFDPRLK